jgi:hypothetical protein
MFSKLLIKLIDQSIVPAVLLIAARVLSVVIAANYYGIKYDLGVGGFAYSTTKDYILVNSLSTFAMLVTLTVGLSYILLKALIFHETHITPKITASLFSLKLSSFIQTSYDLYSQGSIWLSYLFLMTVSTGILSLFGMIYTWVFWVALVLSILATILLIFDIENEMDLNKKTASDNEDYVLNFGETDA